jgi:hypothetical protein
MKSMKKMGQINRTLTIHAIWKEIRLTMVKVMIQKKHVSERSSQNGQEQNNNITEEDVERFL